MEPKMRIVGLVFMATLSLSLAACGGAADNKSELDKLDSKLGGKGDADPALTAALEDQIMVDPELAAQSNDDSIRPPNEPYSGAVPPGEGSATGPAGQTLGVLATQQAQAAKDKFNGCSLDIAYSIQWANRLPVELPLYPKARVNEAAGSDYQGCSLRVASYTAPAPPREVASYYLTLAKRAGFREGVTRDGKGLMVSGWRPNDGAAFYALMNPSGTGTSVDIVSNRGR
jgi:hypothetical protein